MRRNDFEFIVRAENHRLRAVSIYMNSRSTPLTSVPGTHLRRGDVSKSVENRLHTFTKARLRIFSILGERDKDNKREGSGKRRRKSVNEC